MLMKTNIISLILFIAGAALSVYHVVMGYGLGDHFYVGIGGAFLMAVAVGIHKMLNPSTGQ